MFSDTLTITINGVGKVLNRINQDKYSSEYFLRETTGEFSLSIRNTSRSDKSRGGKVIDRHNLELVQTIYPVAPAVYPTINKAYAVFENEHEVTVADAAYFAVGAFAFLTNANVTKMLNKES